jgi:hypothetical protein
MFFKIYHSSVVLERLPDNIVNMDIISSSRYSLRKSPELKNVLSKANVLAEKTATKSVCPICKKKFGRNDVTRKHILRKHPEVADDPRYKKLNGIRREVCSFCGNIYTNVPKHKTKSCPENPKSKASIKKRQSKEHK